MLQDVVDVRHLGGHRLWIRFADGACGEIDMSQWLAFDGVFEPLRDETYFARVRVHEESRTLCWPNDADVDSDVLYSRMTGAPLPTFVTPQRDDVRSSSEGLPRLTELNFDDRGATAPSVIGQCSCTGAPMPIICRFFGIVVTMNFSDHAPPHFHVRYGEWRAAVAIDPPGLLSGRLPPRAVGFVTEWATLHQDELLADWELARNHQPLRAIEPLD